MTFLEQYDGFESNGGDPITKAQFLRTWLAEKPKELFDELRERRPIFESPLGIIITKYTDVLEVLARDQFFSVRLYAPKIERIGGPFIIGMENTPQYERDISILRLAIRREDLPIIRSIIADCVDQLIQAALPQGKIDLVNVSRVVPTRLIKHYFGVPGPDEATVMRWSRRFFHDIFLNWGDDPAVRDAALASGSEIRAYLDKLIECRQSEIKAGIADTNDVLSRLLQMQHNPTTSLDNIAIRNNLIAFITAAISTTSEAIVNVLNELLRRPEQLVAARQAALSNDDELLTRYVNEALRFKPQSPFVVRSCEQTCTIAKGTDRETHILKKGTLVFVAHSSAMFDSLQLDAPEKFCVDRPDTDYLHFGYGMHTCFGRYISRIQITEVTKKLLCVNGLRRTTAPDDQVHYDGPFPDSFIVELGVDNKNSIAC